jgi:hypothetical protein
MSVEGEFKKRLDNFSFGDWLEGKFEDIVQNFKDDAYTEFAKWVGEARKDFPRYVASPTMEGYIGFLADVLEWKTKWFGNMEKNK